MIGSNKRLSLFLVCLFLVSIIPLSTISAEDQGDAEVMQAQDIAAVFDPVSETTTITWRNTNQLWNEINDLFAAEYRVYRSSSQIDSANIGSLDYFANVSACTTESIGGSTSPLDCRGINGVHPGHSVSFLVPPGVNGTFYYAITTVVANGTEELTLDVNASNLYEPVNEITTPIQTPYNVQAYFQGSTSETTVTWINYNDINPIHPETGDDAYKIRVWRTSNAISRDNGQSLLQGTPIAELNAGISSYSYEIPSNTDRDVYYSVTYLLPNYSAPGVDYEDVRFLSQNSMQQSLREDNTPPTRAFAVSAEFDDNNGSGNGFTTITWRDANGEDGESYRIYMADYSFNNTTQAGVQLIGTVDEGAETFIYNLPYGRLGNAYYCVVTIDIYGEYNQDTHPNSCAGPVFEDAFTNWVAEPDNVNASFIGNSTTRITWSDQLGVEGERYHIYWSNYRVQGTEFRENETVQWIGSTTDGVQFYDVILEDGIERDNSFYFVVTEALYEHLSTPFKYTQLVDNVVGPITEDTRSPSPPNILSGQSAGATLETRVEWRNDANENGESYYIYRNIGDPFDNGNASSSTLDAQGWDLLYGPIVENAQSPNTFLSNVPIEADLERNVWYAVVSEDRFGNLNNEIYPGIGGNAIQVLEDTRAPAGVVTIADESSQVYDGISLVQGEYDIRLELNEYLSLSPVVSITTADGELISEEPETMIILNDNINDPDRGPIYTLPLSVTSSLASGNLVFTFSIVDASGNAATITYDERYVDSQRPQLNIFSPSTDSDGSKYLFGEKVTVMASASDDVRIESFRYKFTYRYGAGAQASPWANVTDTTIHEDGAEIYTKMEFPSANFEAGYRHAIELEAIDSAGNRISERVIFVVDLCVYGTDGNILCQYDVNVAPPPEPTYEELSVADPPFLFVWIASLVAIVSMVVAILVISTSMKGPKQKKKGDDDDEEDEDWMSEFIGTSGDLDMDSITGTGSASEEKKEEKEEEKKEEAPPEEDEDDPFAVNKVQTKRRRKKSEPEPEPEEDDFDDEDDDDDDDDFDDDFDDEDEEPKKRSPPKKRAVKRSPPKKRTAPVKRKAVKKKSD